MFAALHLIQICQTTGKAQFVSGSGCSTESRRPDTPDLSTNILDGSQGVVKDRTLNWPILYIADRVSDRN